MFNSKPTDRRHSSALTRRKRSYVPARRLGVEQMERRLMLSSTTIGLAPVQLRFAGVSVASYELNAAAGQSEATPTTTDGGYILFNDSSWGKHTNISGAGQSTPETSISYDDVTYNGQLLSTGVTKWEPATVPMLDSNGLQPTIIPTSNEGVGLTPAITPIIAGPPASTPNNIEGGPIPIQTLLTDFRKEDSVAPAVKALSASKYSAQFASSSGSAVTGELARATVFEIAGGEPGQSGRSSDDNEHLIQKTDDASSQTDQPLSDNGFDRRGDHLKAQDVQVAPTNANIPNVVGPGATDIRTDSPTAAAILDRSAMSEPNRKASGKTMPGNSAVADSSGNSDTTAVESAFDQFGRDKVGILDSNKNSRFWSRSITVSPLLMVLALERIAAIHSRHAARATQSRSVRRQPLTITRLD
jgi:hypothetical protein